MTADRWALRFGLLFAPRRGPWATVWCELFGHRLKWRGNRQRCSRCGMQVWPR